ncbi:MAG: hypothetical protein ACOYOF_21560 [Verrucomicrobiaceae bacterium]
MLEKLLAQFTSPISSLVAAIEAVADGWRLTRKNQLLLRELDLRREARELKQHLFEAAQHRAPDDLLPLHGLLHDIEQDLAALRSARATDPARRAPSGDA